MCGIVGYVGREGNEQRCVEVLMEGLRNLEYRGYDSAGLALQRTGGSDGTETIEAIKRVGPLANLAGAIGDLTGNLGERDEDFFRVRAGVGHTRWATHGKPNEANAHPLLGSGGRVAVVHNGIVENHAELRRELEGRGHVFASETDTEVIAHLLAERVGEYGESLREALAWCVGRIEGSFAVAAVSADEPETIVAARHQSPLVVGLGEDENFLASAVQALLSETRRFLVVENDEIVEITADAVDIFTLGGKKVHREVFEVDWDTEAVELGLYEDYMLKEIHDQPAALRKTLEGRITTAGEVDLSEDFPQTFMKDLQEIERVVIIGCGTAYHAALVGKDAIEGLCRIPVEVAVSSEYRYRNPIGNEKTLVVAISQSGETTDTLAAVETAREYGGRVLAITNTRGSLITREAEAVLMTKAGPEVGVAATKTFTTQLAVLQLLALHLAAEKGVLPLQELHSLGSALKRLPEKVEQAIELSGKGAKKAAVTFEEARCALFLGRGVSFPVALEGALKLKEISYLPAEGYPAGEMKHGPIALVDDGCPVVAVLGKGLLREKTLSNVEETAARGASVIAVGVQGDPWAQEVAEHALWAPEVAELVWPVVASVPLQLLAYHVAKGRGLNVDKPRNLAKSVTVE